MPTQDRTRAARAAVEDEVQALEASLAADDAGDAARRRALGTRLEALRARWRENPALFTPAVVATLRAVARALARAPRPAGADPDAVLREVFGHATFRPGQREIVDAVLEGRDCVGVMPTGAGKSLTYQVPARILGGTTLVVSPLIALMKDQVDAMGKVGLRAAFLNSTLGAEERRERIRA
ncbi:MAG TPA: DEAD/DEAH box helicase, partial [Anaeromyxobacter sp.]